MNANPSLLRLLEALLDGEIPEREYKTLLRELETDSQLRSDLAEQVAMMGALAAVSEPEPIWLDLFREFGDAPSTNFDSETISMIEQSGSRVGFGRFATRTLFAIAAMVMIGLILFKNFPGPDQKPVATNQKPEETATVAIMIATDSSGAQKNSHPAGTYLHSGWIEQSEGWISVQTLSGVSLTLTAPFRARLVDPNRVFVEQGQARVHVPEGAEGFVMESRAFEVLDLGTEFAAYVNADGTGSCRVFEGMTDVSFLDGLRQTSATRRVSAGESVKITPSNRSMGPLADNEGDYAEMQIPPQPLLSLADSYPGDVIGLKPLGYWRFEDIRAGRIANEIPGWADLVMHGDASINTEADGNHSGRLNSKPNNGAFSIVTSQPNPFAGDFTIAMFVQLDWLQNYALFASSRWRSSGPKPSGNQFVFKAYASFQQSGLQGTGLYAVFRDKPAWDGGTEIFGNRPMHPKFWHHVALSRSSGEVTLHLDGKPVAREAIPSIPIDLDHLYIGRSDSPNRPPEFLERSLIGNVDELAIFDRQLSEQEIAILAAGKK